MTSKENNNTLQLFNYIEEILFVQDYTDYNNAIKILKKQKILGIDTEAKPSFIKHAKPNPPALLQVATSNLVILIQLNKFVFNKDLAEILANPKIIKAGVAINDDIKALRKTYDFLPAGICDLASMTKELNINSFGLKTMCEELLQLRISKSARCSNWEKTNLTKKQIDYAATDAYLSRKLFLLLSKEFKKRKIDLTKVIDKVKYK